MQDASAPGRAESRTHPKRQTSSRGDAKHAEGVGQPFRPTDGTGLGTDLLLFFNGNNLRNFGQGGPPGARLMLRLPLGAGSKG